MSVGRVAIVGRDAPLWLAALALDRVLRGAGIALDVVALPSRLQPGEALAATPALAGLHRQLGLDDGALVRAARGLRVGGQHCIGWGPQPFLIGFEGPVILADGADIGQYWAIERQAGATIARDRLSPSAVTMARGRVAGEGVQQRFTVAAGYHLDAAAYAAALEGEAARRGIAVRRGDGVRVHREGDSVRTLDPGDGAIEADLFVDAGDSGLADAPWDSWATRIPTRALRWESAPPLAPRPPFTELVRGDGGWRARLPLADRTAIVSAAGDGSTFDPGCRTPWVGNVVAIGEAACRLEPADLLSLHMVHAGIANLVAWFPADRDMRWERERFNIAVGRTAAHLLDYQACRHDARRARAGSVTLDQRLSLFEAVGQVPSFDDDPVDPGQWERLFAGLGLVPASASVAALALPTARRRQLLAAIVADMDRDAAARPGAMEQIGR